MDWAREVDEVDVGKLSAINAPACVQKTAHIKKIKTTECAKTQKPRVTDENKNQYQAVNGCEFALGV